MKKIIFMALILVKTSFAFNQECSPTFKEIFDFQVGDYFVYNYYTPVCTGCVWPDYDIRRNDSFTISGRNEIGDTLLYTRTGTGHYIKIYRDIYTPGMPSHVFFDSTYLINDTLRYIATDYEHINDCPGTWNTPYTGFDSIKTIQNNCLSMKISMFRNGPPFWPDAIHKINTYAKGLGILSSEFVFFDSSKYLSLQEFIKASNTLPLPKPEILNGDSLFICSGSKAVLRANKSDDYIYQWFRNDMPIQGANQDTLLITYPGTYQVAEMNGCANMIISDPIQVIINETFYIRSFDYVRIDCGSALTLSPDIVTYKDIELIYTWDKDPTLSATDVKNPVALPVNTTTYKLTVSDGSCEQSKPLEVIVNPKTVNAGSDKTLVCGEQVQLDNPLTDYSGTGQLAYSWSPTEGLNAADIAQPIVSATTNKVYALTVSTPEGCKATDTVKVKVVSAGTDAMIDMVSVNENNRNIIYWNREEDMAIDSTFIYCESTSQAGQYNLIGKLLYAETDEFTDTLSDAGIQSNSYRLALKDVCGFITEKSAEHKTMHLSVNKGTGNAWNLIWEDYIGIPVSSYIIYRGAGKSSMVQIGSTSAGSNTYTDETVPEGDNYYQISIQRPESKSGNNVSVHESPVSNIVGIINEITRINDMTDAKAFIYPNPASDKLLIDKAFSPNATIEIYDLQGKQVLYKQIGTEAIDINNISKGLYTIRLIDTDIVLINKFVKK
jgi:hypothetical protein